eukprot:TRINITY_DN2139_c0_g1_i1.p1 TRINITY_DN2139_c0_g1~~TRINITY_DN2139_c0_g1_i1.p1  ORF type:complete len:257 (+),score=61.86 TRINITY_DN2139_c0_g1_i1:43-813(+)
METDTKPTVVKEKTSKPVDVSKLPSLQDWKRDWSPKLRVVDLQFICKRDGIEYKGRADKEKLMNAITLEQLKRFTVTKMEFTGTLSMINSIKRREDDVAQIPLISNNSDPQPPQQKKIKPERSSVPIETTTIVDQAAVAQAEAEFLAAQAALQKKFEERIDVKSHIQKISGKIEKTKTKIEGAMMDVEKAKAELEKAQKTLTRVQKAHVKAQDSHREALEAEKKIEDEVQIATEHVNQKNREKAIASLGTMKIVNV